MKKITKAQSKRFNQKIKNMLLSENFVQNKTITSYQFFFKQTNFGLVEVTLYEQTGEVWDIFTCFQDIEKARTIFNCNKFTGKYNFHELIENEQIVFGNFEFFLHELNFDLPTK